MNKYQSYSYEYNHFENSLSGILSQLLVANRIQVNQVSSHKLLSHQAALPDNTPALAFSAYGVNYLQSLDTAHDLSCSSPSPHYHTSYNNGTSQYELTSTVLTQVSECDFARFRCMSSGIDLNTFNSLLRSILGITAITSDRRGGRCTSKYQYLGEGKEDSCAAASASLGYTMTTVSLDVTSQHCRENYSFLYRNERLYFSHSVTHTNLNTLNFNCEATNKYLSWCYHNYIGRLSNYKYDSDSDQHSIEYNLHLKGEITLVPSLSKFNYPKDYQNANLIKTQDIVNNNRIVKYLLLESNYDYEEFNSVYKTKNKFYDLVKRLAYNRPISYYSINNLLYNAKKVTKFLYKTSRNKYLHELNRYLYSDPISLQIANSQQSYMMVKNQYLFETEVPQLAMATYVTDFIRDNFMNLVGDNYGVILAYTFLKNNQTEINYEFANYLLTDQSCFKMIEENLNSIELYKTILYLGLTDTVNNPLQNNFFEYINDNLSRLYENIVFKEMLLYIFKYGKTYDLQALISNLASNLTKFFDNYYGIQIIKTVFEHHVNASTFYQVYNEAELHLEMIFKTRYLNILYFDFLERDLYPNFDNILINDTSNHALHEMTNILHSRVGYNSMSALVKKYGYAAISNKFDYLHDYVIYYGGKKTNIVLRSIKKLQCMDVSESSC
eukprot:Mrub_01059.p1 GENE.Mrub_01059~~Mrub_01059.p1  ORF type:complete len:745 (-),score=106.36 Mrub_01059:218-2218(-)